jgi:transposase
MRLYCGIDLHSNNSYVVVLDEQDRVVYQRRLRNELELILGELTPYAEQLVGTVVESTFNWYWLVDGLMEAGYRAHLANPNAMQRYDGLKFADDRSDARWLAHMLRIGVLPEGYIYPREQRALRDLLRKRGRMVQQRTANVLSLQNLVHRNTGRRLSGKALREMEFAEFDSQHQDANLTLALESTRRVLECIDGEVKQLEQEVLRQLKPDALLRLLKTVAGVGDVLAPTILLETGQIDRFRSAGKYVSYCRCVGSKHLSNGKSKGKGNRKNGNPYLAWAYVEAAHFAIRYHASVRRFYERKQARTHRVVALKAVAHKLARASYYVMRNRVPFQIDLAFG